MAKHFFLAALSSLVLLGTMAEPLAAQEADLGAQPIFSDGFENGDLCAWETGLACLDDDFDDGVIQAWNFYRPEDAAILETGGELRLEPVANSLWFQGSSSVLLWKPVTGDFKVTAAVVTRRLPPNDTEPPLVAFRLGGIMARDGAAAEGEDYVFVVLGADHDAVSVEAKSTDNSQSTFDGAPVVAGGEAELRLCRLGAEFRFYYRAPGGAWQAHSVIPAVTRPDLPATLQVGPLAYANQANPDLRVSYDWITFEPLSDFMECLQ
jgi:hypothetical protein